MEYIDHAIWPLCFVFVVRVLFEVVFFSWDTDCSLGAPSKDPYPPGNCTGRNSGESTPFRNRFSDSFEYDPHITARVIRLLKFICPTAISRTIITVVIYPIQGVFARFWAHVRKELWKGKTPSLAHSYTSSAIILPMGMRRIEASIFNFLPASIKWMLGKAMRFGHGTHLVSSMTSAGFGCFTAQRKPSDNCYASTLTSALPIRNPFAYLIYDVVGKSENLKSSVSSALKINKI